MDYGILIADSFFSLSSSLALMKAGVGVGFVIFVHELGHFLVAKACGVKCDKFYVGFDPPIKIAGIDLPRSLFKTKWGETEYGIGIVPLGGYVRMLGQADVPLTEEEEAAEQIKLAQDGLDPRSFRAKSVLQRMAIMSAGVIFNLIFAVLLAATAYKMGVKYIPTVVGGSNIGDPAWFEGVKPGDRIVSLSPDKPDSDHLRFINDLKFTLFTVEEGDEVNMRIKDTEGHVRPVTIEPFGGYKKQVGMPTIGVWMASQPVVFEVFEDTLAQQADLKPGDRITAITVEGQRTEIDPDAPSLKFQAILAKSQLKPITLSVDRVDQETEVETQHDIEIGVEEGQRFGVELTMGPIVCIHKGSVAEQIGLKVGDVITQINDQPIGDPLTLPLRLLEYVDQQTQLTIQRGEATEQVTITMPAPPTNSDAARRNAPNRLSALGIGYTMNPTVSGILKDSPASEAGLEVGDVVQSVKLLLPEVAIPEEKRWKYFPGLQEARQKQRNLQIVEAYDLDVPVPVDEENNNWPFIVQSVQKQLVEFEIDLQFKRGNEVKTVRMRPAKSNTVVASRGFRLKPLEEVREAATWSEALALGRREVWEGMLQVVFLLRKITTNIQHVGGPITIVRAATMQASEGLPTLLIFLTMLSANLAVLNFLPIPVLDGGHMVFLIWEGIVGKPVNPRVHMGLTLIGFFFIACLMVVVLTMDVWRWVV